MRLRHAWMVLLALALLAPAAAGDQSSERVEVRQPPCYVAEVPGCSVIVEREVVVPAVVKRICTPIYDEVKIPIEETRLTPRYEEVEVPVYGWRIVPVYDNDRIPIWVDHLEPVYMPVKRRYSIPVCSPFQCACSKVTLYEKCDKVQVAWKATQKIDGHRTESYARGLRREQYLVRTEKKRVIVGHDVETVQVGVRVERHLKGYATEVIEIEPATKRIVREEVRLPARRVTVAAGDSIEALPGTVAVVTPAEYEALLATK